MAKAESKKVMKVYTDGSCLGNPGPGGWAVIVAHDGEDIVLRGHDAETTNNRMEMTAVIEALKWLQENKKRGWSVELYSDSSLIVKSMTEGWKRKKNQDLWGLIDEYAFELGITWHWVKGHHVDKHNIKCDKIAVEEAKKAKKELLFY